MSSQTNIATMPTPTIQPLAKRHEPQPELPWCEEPSFKKMVMKKVGWMPEYYRKHPEKLLTADDIRRNLNIAKPTNQ